MKKSALLSLAIIMLFALSACSSSVKFDQVIEKVTAPECCEVASDGSYLKIDTNPSNTSKYYNPDYVQTIKEVNEALGFPESLWEKMSQTRAMDGRMTDENDAFTVSWSYHPDKGMNVLYERK